MILCITSFICMFLGIGILGILEKGFEIILDKLDIEV